MIRVDFGESQDGPTLWLLIDTLPSFGQFCDVVEDLSNRDDTVLNCTTRTDLFEFEPEVLRLVMSGVSAFRREGVQIKLGKGGADIRWSLRRNSWSDVLDKVRGLTPATHNYIDYNNATILISLLENLQKHR